MYQEIQKLAYYFFYKEKIENWLQNMQIFTYHLSENLIIDVFSDVYLYQKNLKKIPFQFGVVKGDFYCSQNQLESLKGCPQEVQGSFYCYENQLMSLEYCPKKVGENFDCSKNQLVSLKGIPKKIHGDLNCSFNLLQFVDDCPQEIKGQFDLNNNQLQSLEFLSEKIQKISGNLWIDQNLFSQDFLSFLEKNSSDIVKSLRYYYLQQKINFHQKNQNHFILANKKLKI